MRLFMETTEVPAERTAQEIHVLLAEAGARQVLTEYNDKREITGIHFVMSVANQHIPFKMPVRTEKIYEYFYGRARKTGYINEDRKLKLREKAKRVAWRQLLRWVQAQLAFIDSGMADTAEVFMPYVQVAPDVTLYQRAIATGFSQLALPPAGKPE